MFHFEPRSQQELIQVTAEVVDKEYCQARKPENRFKVETHKMNIFQKNKNQNQYLSEEKGDIAGDAFLFFIKWQQCHVCFCQYLSKRQKWKPFFSGGEKKCQMNCRCGWAPSSTGWNVDHWRGMESCSENLVQNFNQILTLWCHLFHQIGAKSYRVKCPLLPSLHEQKKAQSICVEIQIDVLNP